MTEYDSPSSITSNEIGELPWYYKKRIIVVGFVLGIWPGLVLLALRPPRSKKKYLIISAVAVGTLIVSSLSNSTTGPVGGSTTTTTSVPKFSYKDFLVTGVVVSDEWAPTCTDISKVIKEKNKKYDALIASGKKLGSDPYSAQSLTQKVSWWNVNTAFVEDVKKEVTTIVSRVYPNFMTAAGIEVVNTENGASMIEEIDRDVLTSCDLLTALTDVQSKARILEGIRINVQSAAGNVPWYPKGYSEFESGIAYKWLSTGQFSCSYSSSSCWGMSVTSQSGCSSLYVEITILDSQGNNIGYTNDTTSGLQPGQNAKMIFDSFENNASKARLAKVSCY